MRTTDNNQLCRDITLKSESLNERAKHPNDFYTALEDDRTAITRTEEFKKIISTDRSIAEKYLKWSNAESFESLPLGNPKDSAIPITQQTWTATLESLFSSLDQAYKNATQIKSGDREPDAIELLPDCTTTRQIYTEIIPEELDNGTGIHSHSCAIAVSQLQAACTQAELSQLADPAFNDLVRHLWSMQQRLCNALFRRTKKLLAQLSDQEEQKNTSFSQWLIEENGYKNLLAKHCALARLIAESIECWVNDTSLFLKRFHADKSKLHKIVAISSNPKIVKIDDGLSDPHSGKQFVKRLWLDNGSGLIYKPRDISLLQKLSSTLDELRKDPEGISLKTPACLTCDEHYGWAELISHKECRSKQQVETYYKHCGQLAALLYITRTNDIHHENLIACADQPVIVDTDTLFYPGFYDLIENSDDFGKNYIELAIEESVVSSGLLPLWDTEGKHGELRDASGMSSTQKTSQNQVFLGEILQHPYDYTEFITDGFRQAISYILKKKDYFQGLIHSFQGCLTRPIYRPTRIYERLRQDLLNPRHLTDGITRSIKIEFLKTSLLKEKSLPMAWKLVNEEAKMLFKDEIPMFLIPCGQDAMRLSNGTALPFRCGVDIAKQRLERLNPEWIDYQIELIRASCQFASATGPGDRSLEGEKRTDTSTINDWERQQLFQNTAEKIIARIQSRSHFSEAHGSSWIGLNVLEEHGKMQLANAGLGLYDGNAGIALILNQAQLIQPTPFEQSLSPPQTNPLEGLKPIQALAKDPVQIESFIENLGLGAMTGLGSLIYSCIIFSTLQNSKSILQTAEQLAKGIPQDAIQNESCADVMTGLAGLLLAIIELEKLCKQEYLCQMSVMIGDKIIDLRRPSERQHLFAWPNKNNKMLTGFSHGVAGISLALFRLYKQTGIKRFRDAALNAIEYENLQRDARTGHWLDLRGDTPNIMNSWCNGAPGIGLARLEMHKIESKPEFVEDMERAIHLSLQERPFVLDQLCCGALGISELLLNAGTYFQNQTWLNTANEIAHEAIKAAKPSNRFRLLRTLPTDLPFSGFMQGDAGIAYQLLRLNHPEQFPSILALSTQRQDQSPQPLTHS